MMRWVIPHSTSSPSDIPGNPRSTPSGHHDEVFHALPLIAQMVERDPAHGSDLVAQACVRVRAD